MQNKKYKEFEIKKKTYCTPQLRKYGTFAEYTKGNFGSQGEPDGQQYYGNDLIS